MKPVVALLGSMYDPDAEALLAAHTDLRRVESDDADGIRHAVAEAHGIVAKYPVKIDSNLISGAPHLVAVLSSGRGVDNIDIEAATAAGVIVANNPGLGGPPVSEHTLGLLIMLTRDLDAVERYGIDGAWDRRLTTRRVELGGAVLGIVGLGNVGSSVARLASAGFGCRVLSYDPYVSAETMAECGAVKVAELSELLGQADFVTLHPELNEETEHMFNDETFAQMMPGSYFVNASRGKVVDTEALVRALQSGHLGGAALDVYEEEPLAADSPLLQLDNVVLSAHIADFTVQTKRKLAFSAATKLLEALSGTQPASTLNPLAWPLSESRRQELLALV